MTTAVRPRGPLTVDEIYALPAMNPAQATVCAVFGISASLFYELVASGGLPVPTVKVGRLRLVRRADILRAVGLTENDNSAGVATPALLVEHVTETA